MKKVLLIEALANSGSYLVEAANGLGIEAFVATHEDVYGTYPQALRRGLRGAVFTDLADSQRALKDMEAFCRAEGINGVAGCWEFFTPLVAQLAARLGLPGNVPELAAAGRNKAAMAEAFRAGGVPAPATVIARTWAEAVDRIALAGMGYPLVVKPAEQGGSWGVSVVGSAAGLAEAVREAQAWPAAEPHQVKLDQRVVVQEYVSGAEYSIDTIASKGSFFHMPVVEKHTTGGSFRAELGHTAPAPLHRDLLPRVHAVTERALTALGIRDGVAHTEVKIASHESDPVVLEVGARLPGDNLVDVVRHACGVDEARAYLQAVLGERPDTTATRERACAIRFLTPPRAGIFRGVRVRGPQEEGVERHISVEPGTPVRDARDNSARVGHLLVTAETPAQANAAAATALAGTSVEVEVEVEEEPEVEAEVS
ncbi:ATP-grasp domain-containing protein [Streptomyces sp. ISL-100]|uniref:ATP-grasp domain-containing protein n=1 Tax=Streptomyces sp. ISL-100 TaxID=2819173 RepID=UPI001BED2052|nr:ATP-grasp domain-containing protein [Streptomyces sp. ISL-100]MBT2395808.1 ATP-grasp domain-containing protein [Streptomyces sp. ISL-100]